MAKDEIFKSEKYELPTKSIIEFQPNEKGEVTHTELTEKEEDAPDIHTAPKLEILRYAAKKGMNVDILDPDQSCHRCHGTGYVSVDAATRMPNGCRCIFPSFPTNIRRIEKQKLREQRMQNQGKVAINA